MNHPLQNSGRVFLASLTIAACLSGCHRNNPKHVADGPDMSGSSSPEPARKMDLEGALRYVRNGQFSHVWVFSRHDGKPIDGTDGNYIRANAPHLVDCVVTDDKKKAVAGSNFDIEQAGFDLLKKRFVVEDYSGK
jgi:hypothetical protein